MKGNIIRVENNANSLKQSKLSYNSFTEHGWDVEYISGITKKSIDEDDFPYKDLEGGRLDSIQQNEPKKYLTKKSCLFNNLKFAERVIENDEPMMFIEHDAICIRDKMELDFDEFCFMCFEYAFDAPSALDKPPFNQYSVMSPIGVNNFPKDYPLRYYRPTHYKGYIMTPGTACYALTPKGAEKVLYAASKGLEQSDFLINSKVVRLQYIYPSICRYNNINLNLSHKL